MKIAFAGMGVMGAPMARHLKAAGHELVVFNRSPDKAKAWAQAHGGGWAPTAKAAAQGCELFILCVGNDDDVRQVVTEAAAATAEGAVIVDHTTASAHVAREMAELCAGMGRAFVDAPVSGGQAGAENGQLTVMAGGDQSAFDRVEPVLRAYSKAVTLMGPSGAGQLTKMVNQICLAGLIQGLAEAMHFVKCSGLDPDTVYAAISKGAAQSWQMDNRWKAMTDNKFEFGFAVDWMRKDLGLVLEEGRSNGAHLAVTALVDQFYSEVQSLGGRRWDTSSLAARLEDRRKPQA
jgi:3-hydroxyisobutyrate dehydrogenase